MTRRSGPVAVAAAVLIVFIVAVVPLVSVATPTAASANATGVAPGQQLGGVVDVGEAELETDVAGRSFDLAVARADSPAGTAAVIERHVDKVERSVEALEARVEGLRAARANGSLSPAAFRARVAGIAAERAGAARLANATTAASANLPAAVLAANGVNVDAIRQLQDRARSLGGREVATIAREIAGPSVGQPPGPPAGVPDGPGGAGDAPGVSGNATAGADRPVTAGGPPTDRSRKLLVRLAE